MIKCEGPSRCDHDNLSSNYISSTTNKSKFQSVAFSFQDTTKIECPKPFIKHSTWAISDTMETKRALSVASFLMQDDGHIFLSGKPYTRRQAASASLANQDHEARFPWGESFFLRIFCWCQHGSLTVLLHGCGDCKTKELLYQLAQKQFALKIHHTMRYLTTILVSLLYATFASATSRASVPVSFVRCNKIAKTSLWKQVGWVGVKKDSSLFV